MRANTYLESLETVLAATEEVGAEDVAFNEVTGRIPVVDVRALADDPPAPKSAMDGFALRAEETAEASPDKPVEFAYSEVVGAGHVARGAVPRQGAVRIMTGALMPEGTDAVVKAEETDAGEAAGPSGTFHVFTPLRPGENVFACGSRIGTGDLLVPAGEPVSPQGLGLCAGQGLARVRVFRRPRIALLALGDELVQPGTPLQPGQIYVSNLHALEAEARREGAAVVNLGIAPDEPRRIEALLQPHAQGSADLVITLGGSHRGDFDFVGDVLERLGAAIRFQRTLIGWGGSTVFATRGATLFFGLPGTPLASWLAFEVLVRPALWKMAGRKRLDRRVLTAQLGATVIRRLGRTHFVPVRLSFDPGGPPLAQPLEERPRNGLPSSLLADGYILCPDGTERLEGGTLVPVTWLRT
jgi:molybdopterin molybdotransferase